MELREKSLEMAIMEELVREKVPVTVCLTNGMRVRGTIARYDALVIVLIVDDVQQIIYKHSISALEPIRQLRAAAPKN